MADTNTQMDSPTMPTNSHLCYNPKSDGYKSPPEELAHDNIECSECACYLCNKCRILITPGFPEDLIDESALAEESKIICSNCARARIMVQIRRMAGGNRVLNENEEIEMKPDEGKVGDE